MLVYTYFSESQQYTNPPPTQYPLRRARWPLHSTICNSTSVMRSHALHDLAIDANRRRCSPNKQRRWQNQRKWDLWQINWDQRIKYCPSWFQAPAAMLMRSALFWDITRRRVVNVHRLFGTTCRNHFHGSRVREGTDTLSLNVDKQLPNDVA
jgi:hypothetical protein